MYDNGWLMLQLQTFLYSSVLLAGIEFKLHSEGFSLSVALARQRLQCYSKLYTKVYFLIDTIAKPCLNFLSPRTQSEIPEVLAVCDIIIILGQQLWFNQAHAHHASYYNYMYPDTWGKSGIPLEKYPFHTYYGDGSAISEDVLQVFVTNSQNYIV